MLRKLALLALAALFFVAIGSSGGSAPARHRLTVTRATLPNGLQIVVLRDTLAPVVTTWLNIEQAPTTNRIPGWRTRRNICSIGAARR